MTQELEDVLEAVLAEARVLEANGASFSPARVRQLVKDVQTAAEPWMTFLSEGDAAIRCGRNPSWLRAQFPQMQRDNNARMVNGRHRQYRQCAVVRRADVDTAAARGRAAARAARAQVDQGAQLSA